MNNLVEKLDDFVMNWAYEGDIILVCNNSNCINTPHERESFNTYIRLTTVLEKAKKHVREYH